MLIRNLIYILQAELYDEKKFFRFCYSHFRWWRLERRARLVWTKKARLIYGLTFFQLLVYLTIILLTLGRWGILFVPIAILMLPIVIIVSLEIIKPLDKALKNRLLKRAKQVFASNRNDLTVIGITGSLGKTSEREILFSILSEKFRVIKLSENINTDLGVAEFILQNPNVFQKKDIFIVEMGAHKKGDIKKICDLVRPDYGIITGINESHLERFGSLENIISAKFELAEAVSGTVVLNFEDENIKNNYKRFNINYFLGVNKNRAEDIEILDNFQGFKFKVDEMAFETKLLARHNIILILLAIEIAKKLEMNLRDMARGVEKIKCVSHRLEPICNRATDVWVIDDSYNGNFDGVVSGLEVLKRHNGRKIVLTPGLVELGEKTEEIHEKIGRLYAQEKIELVLLIKSPAIKYIINGLKKENFSNYKVYDTTQEAHKDLPNVIVRGDAIIFQNDLTDNYF